VRVRFLPSDPQSSAEVDSIAAMWGFPMAALLFAFMFIGLALYDSGYFAR
jgi:hypothetical protein